MGEIGVLATVELLALLQVERGGIASKPPVKLARQPDELLQRPAAFDHQDLNRMWQWVLCSCLKGKGDRAISSAAPAGPRSGLRELSLEELLH
jgi:hypothetical protein